jgi:hypothetical protein
VKGDLLRPAANPRGRRRWTVAVMLAVPLFLAACGSSTTEEAAEQPAVVKQVKGTGVKLVILSTSAAKRLGVQLTTVRRAGSGTHRTAIPYSAVLYDANGDTWTYTSPKHLVFVRRDIAVASVDGDVAILTKGPPVGTPVVAVGSTEIWGVEYGGIEED